MSMAQPIADVCGQVDFTWSDFEFKVPFRLKETRSKTRVKIRKYQLVKQLLYDRNVEYYIYTIGA